MQVAQGQGLVRFCAEDGLDPLQPVVVVVAVAVVDFMQCSVCGV